ncbi:hypothetical protein PVAND_008662 [Polypedilum vanderplanki]|uniref:Uncharacterized protein n=1 Tax=Polypedilum vanderplanki TaxID=319348 RepID=A0A9J6CAA1_POLVA|nr:hypothetical protein PVAND_008662 [Polypedilum vanderplanki]
MKLGLGILVLYLTIYTAKSLYVSDADNKNNNESNDIMEQQQQSNRLIHDAIKINLLPTTSSTILNKLVPFETKDDDRSGLKALKRMTLFPTPSRESDEITVPAEIIEIEVPIIGNEFQRNSNIEKEQSSSYEDPQIEINAEFNFDESTTETTTAAAANFQSSNDETTFPTTQQTSSSFINNNNIIESATDIHEIESRLVDQYHDNNMIDYDEKFQPNEDYDVKKIFKPIRHRFAFPFNVKIVVNNDDVKRSCKSKRSCSQVNFSKSQHNIDREYYLDETDLDDELFFKSEPQAKSRRAADDGFFNAFNGFSLTPAPRMNFAAANNNNIRAIQKPTWFERFENESSLERSERINKDLSNLMKFVAVWAHVDKFVSDRTRSVIRRLASMADEDYGDYIVGSRRRENILKAAAEKADEPFT